MSVIHGLYGDRKSISAEDAKVLRVMIEKLWGADPQALIYLRYIFHSFVRYEQIFGWLKQNGITGNKITEYFQNEAALPNGHGMIEPIRKILGRIDGDKNKMLNKKEMKLQRKFN